MNKKVASIILLAMGATLLGYHFYSEKSSPSTDGVMQNRQMQASSGNVPTPLDQRRLPTESMLSESQIRDNELRQILSLRYAKPESEITLTVTKSSGNMLYGFVGVGCKDGVPYEENVGCSAIFYANKLADGWRIVDGNGFSCNEVLNIGIAKNFDSYTSNCTQ